MSTPRFKIGDEVTVSENPVDKNYQPFFAQGMEPSKGKSAKIVRCFVGNGGNYYNIASDDVDPSYSYHEDWLSLKSELKRGDLVWISDTDMDCSSKHERIFVTKIEGCKYPYVCVSGSDENEFHSGQEFTKTYWRYAKKVETQEVQEAKEYTIEELHKMIGHEFKIKK
jgi:hypothetical protein